MVKSFPALPISPSLKELRVIKPEYGLLNVKDSLPLKTP